MATDHLGAAVLGVAVLGVGNKPFPYGALDVDTVQRLADLAWETAEQKRTQEFLAGFSEFKF